MKKTVKLIAAFLLVSVIQSQLCASASENHSDSVLSRLTAVSSVMLKIKNFEKSISKFESRVPNLRSKALINGLLAFDRNGILRGKDTKDCSPTELLSNQPIYFVVSHQDRDGNFDFAMILENDRRRDGNLLSPLRDILNFLLNLTRPRVSNNSQSLSDFVSTVRQKIDALELMELDDFIVAGTSHEFALSLKKSLESHDSGKGKRSFQAAELHIEGSEDFILYWNYRASKHLLVPLGFASEESWKVDAPNSPWSLQKCSIIDDDRLYIDFTSVDAATIPLTGSKKMNLFWKPIAEYPPMPDSSISYYVESINQQLMSDFVMKESDEIYGQGVSEKFSDPLAAFEIGLGRENLGSTTAQVYFGPNHYDKLKLISLELDEDKSSRDYFAKFLSAFAERDTQKRGIDSNYEKSEHQGLEILWTRNFDDKRGRILREQNWFYSRQPGEPHREMPVDFGFDIKRRKIDLQSHADMINKAESKDAIASVSKDFAGLTSGKGVAFSDRWAAFGNWFQVNSVVNWDSERPQVESSDKLKIDGTFEVFEREKASAGDAAFYHLSVVRDSGNISTIHFFRDLVLKPLGRRGVLDIRNDPSEIGGEQLSEHQKIRLQVLSTSKTVRSLKPLRVETRWLNEDRTRHFSRISWQLSSP